MKNPRATDDKGCLRKHPRGSEGYVQRTAIASFFETVGVLAWNDLVGKVLVFDRWPVVLLARPATARSGWQGIKGLSVARPIPLAIPSGWRRSP